METLPLASSRDVAQVNPRPERTLADRDPPATHRREDRPRRQRRGANARRRRPHLVREMGIVALRLVLVAPAHADHADAGREELVPPADRGEIRLVPEPLPDLDRVEPVNPAVLPRAVGVRMIHRDERVLAVRRLDRPLQVASFATPEVDPGARAPDVRVPVVGRELHPGQEQQRLRARSREAEVVARRVVVGDGEEVQPPGPRRPPRVAPRSPSRRCDACATGGPPRTTAPQRRLPRRSGRTTRRPEPWGPGR